MERIKNIKSFCRSSFFWLLGTIIGNGMSIYSICDKDINFRVCNFYVTSDILNIIGISIVTLFTVLYAFKTWYDSLTIDGGEYK